MSKRITKSKLRLDRETVRGLSPAELDAINGGVRNTGCDSACTQCGGGKPTRPHQPQGGNPLDTLDGGRAGRPFGR
jgi:hypothetical protein